MDCPSCGATVPPGTFCISCGAPFPGHCPACGTANPPAAKFCAECGTGLNAAPRIRAVRDSSAPAAPVPQAAAAEAERRQLTVMFADLVGSTALSARLDPEELCDVLRAYRGAVAGAVARFEGHIAKFMGDGVLAYFGYPKAHEDAAERAVRAGLEAVRVVGALTPRAAPPLQVRVGIATGLVVVGDLIGEGAAQEQTVVGDTPNLAARLQELAEPSSVVVGPRTHRLLGGTFDCADLGPHRLKGFAEPVRAWRVLGPSAAEGRFEARQAGGLTPLVGRKQELALLLERWQRAKLGEGQVILLAGEPGIGKSRLVQALREHLSAEPHTRLSHHCSPHHVTSPLHPVIEHLERAAGFERDDTAAAKLAKLEALLRQAGTGPAEAVPLLAALLSLPTGDRYPPLDLTPQRQRARTLEALLGQLVGLAAKQPVLLVLEDAHWSDPTTRELFDLTVERVRNLPALVVITCRPEFRPPWTGHGHVTALNLTRLSRRQGAALVGRVVDKALPAEVVAQIVAKTDGVPLFVEELTKAVLESDLLHDQGDRYALAGPLPALAIPSTLQDSLLARLERLAPVREVAQIGAALGREFAYDLLAAVAPLGEAELQDALGQLCSSELVFCRGTPPATVYSFKHALVRDAAYQSLLKSKRQQLHARIARVLEERFPATAETEPELLAHHCAQAGLAEKAVKYWHRAGQRALARSATAEAVAQLSQGLEALQDLPDGPERRRRELGLQLTLGQALTAARGFAAPETGRAYARAGELCREVGDTPELFPALYGQYVVHFQRAELEAAHGVAQELLRLAREQGDAAAEVTGHRIVGAASFQLGRLAAARAHLERGLALYELGRDRTSCLVYAIDSRVICCHWLAHALLALGYPEQARARSREALAHARDLAHPNTMAQALCCDGVLHQLLRDRQAAREQAEALIALATEQGFPLWRAAGTVVRGWALVGGGRRKKDIAQIRQGLTEYRATGAELWSPYFLALLADAHGRVDEAPAGVSLLADALDQIERTGVRWIEAELHRLQGELLLACAGSDWREAEARFGQALAVAREQGARLWELRAATSLARLWREAGQRTEAHGLLAPTYGWFTEGLDTQDLQDAKALLDELG